jgi:hypothetical protein
MYFYSVQDDREINVADSTIYRSTRSFWSHFFIFSWSDEAYKKRMFYKGKTINVILQTCAYQLMY